MLPNFLIIGAPRSGSTYLYFCLREHPDVFMPEIRFMGDLHFFNPKSEIDISSTKNWDKGLDWYESLFKDYSGQKAVGEKTASYLSDKETPQLIRQVLPQVKMIAMLRNPIQRAYSDFWYHRGEIPKDCDIIKASIIPELNRLKLIESGFYYEQILTYFKYFDRRQFSFHLLDDFKGKPLEEFRKVFTFLEVAPDFVPEYYNKKVNRAVRQGGLVYWIKLAGGFVKQKLPGVYRVINKLPVTDHLFNFVGKSGDKSTDKIAYPAMSDEEWQFLSDIYLESNRNLSEILEVDLVKLWHTRKPN